MSVFVLVVVGVLVELTRDHSRGVNWAFPTFPEPIEKAKDESTTGVREEGVGRGHLICKWS